MTTSELGAATEARFIMDASRQGFRVSKPFAENPGYDMVVDTGRRLVRVQVKGARMCKDSKGQGMYVANVDRHGRRRRPKFEVLAVFMEQDGRWVFLPRSLSARKQIRIYPNGKYTRRGWEIFRR